MIPGGSIPPLGTKISMLAEHKVVGARKKKISDGSLRVIARGDIPISISWFLDLWILAMGEIALCISPWLRVHVVSWKICYPSPARCCHPAGIITVFKRPFRWFSSQLLQGIVHIIRTVYSPSTNPLPCFVCHNISSLLRSNVVCNIMMVNYVCCKSPCGGFAISIRIREGIFISAASVYSSEIKTLPLLCWK